MKKWKPEFLFPLLFLALAPIVYFSIQWMWQTQELDSLEERLDTLQRKSLSIAKEASQAKAFLESVKNADHFYIDKHLESVVFLDSEMKSLQAYSFQNTAGDHQKERLEFIQNKNRLLFAEENIQRSASWQETIERQQKPVEINEEDLKKLMSLIEGVAIDPYQPPEKRPQLVIQNFELTKKPISSQDKVYILNMQLIKREQLVSPLDNK